MAFTVPLQTNVKQLIVSRADFGDVSKLADLGGKEIYANPLSVGYQRLQKLERKTQARGQAAHQHQGRRTRTFSMTTSSRW